MIIDSKADENWLHVYRGEKHNALLVLERSDRIYAISFLALGSLIGNRIAELLLPANTRERGEFDRVLLSLLEKFPDIKTRFTENEEMVEDYTRLALGLIDHMVKNPGIYDLSPIQRD